MDRARRAGAGTSSPRNASALEPVLDALQQSISQLEAKRLLRSAQEFKLQLAKALMEQEAWEEALRILRPLWQSMSYRDEGWWDVVEEIAWATRTVAARVGDGGAVVAVDWELMHDVFMPRRDWPYDIMKALDGLGTVSFKPVVVIRDQDVHSFLSATFAFEHGQGKVGESCTSQLMVTSRALPVAAPVTLTEIKIVFEGGMKPVILKGRPAAGPEEARAGGILHRSVALRDAPAGGHLPPRDSRHAALYGEADLTFPPGTSKVFEFITPLREAGEAKAVSATFILTTELFDLDYIFAFDRTTVPDVWWCQRGGKKRMVRPDPHAMAILPKPPKMDLHFQALPEQYYTNERIELRLDISNGEDEESVATLLVQITGDQPPPFTLRSAGPPGEGSGSESTEAGSSHLELGSIMSAGSTSAILHIPPVMVPSIYDVTVELSYHLVSDMETPISKKTTIRLLVVSPFEANYDFSPRLDPTPWPSYFNHDEDEASTDEKGKVVAAGLSQRWCLTTRYASFATEPLLIEAVGIETISLHGGITCTTTDIEPRDQHTSLTIQPKSIEESRFLVQVQKLSLDDRRSASLDLQLVIQWRRPTTSPDNQHQPQRAAADDDDDETVHSNTTKLPIPRLLVAGSEPRVLASVTYARAPTNPPIPLLTLTFTIENPSLHFLTFSITTSNLPSISPTTTTTTTAAPNQQQLQPASAPPPHPTRNRTRSPLPPAPETNPPPPPPTFAFSGPKQTTLQLLPLSRRALHLRILPDHDDDNNHQSGGHWIRVGFVVRDRYFQKVLRVLPGGDGVRALGVVEGGVGVWVPGGWGDLEEGED